MPLQLHAVIAADEPLAPENLHGGARVVAVRELGAAVTETSAFASPSLSPELVDAHRDIVDHLFLSVSVLPAPVGTIFASEEALTKWLGLHYVALSDALAFVDDRNAARVHICRDEACDPADAVGVDLAAAAAEAFRSLRRRSVAAIPLRVEHFTGVMVSGAFLVERDLWREFLKAVSDLGTENRGLTFTASGPWAPYDFINMQLGG